MTNLDFEGEHVAALVAPADALDARGHIEAVILHTRPVAHYPRLPDDAPVLVAPSFVQSPPGTETQSTVASQMRALRCWAARP